MDENRFQELAGKWLNGSITESEKKEFSDWYEQKGTNKNLPVPESVVPDEYTHQTRIWQAIQQRSTPVVHIKRYRTFYRIAAAAVIIGLLATGYWIFDQQKIQPKSNIAIHQPNDVLPGRENAILTMSDGRTLSLDSISGTFINNESISINNKNGLLSYHQHTSDNSKPEIHTISTAKGNKYDLLLADGTRVWLNAASSLTFPTNFTGKTRTVELNGEGYFEVAKNSRQPFHVKIGDQIVEVLGTHFNINGYTDEGIIRTTLLEGSVKVIKGKTGKILKPGQQAQLLGNGTLLIEKNIDTDQIMAWKEGFFQFDQTSAQEMLRQLSRWYDVDVQYEKEISDRKFGGRISRKLKLSAMLEMLRGSGVKFRIEGKKLIVTE